MALRHRLMVSAQRPWYTFNVNSQVCLTSTRRCFLYHTPVVLPSLLLRLCLLRLLRPLCLLCLLRLLCLLCVVAVVTAFVFTCVVILAGVFCVVATEFGVG